MSVVNYTLLNNILSQIVKFGSTENLNNFHTSHHTETLGDKNYFSRTRKMPLSSLLSFILMPRSKSTEIELLDYSHLTETPCVNKSNFSKRRQLIPAGYLSELNDVIVREIYNYGDIDLWYGHVLLAADGTTYSLPDTPEIKAQFLQGRKTGWGAQPLARGVVVKDVLNDVIISSSMECYGRDEISLLCDQLDNLTEDIRKQSPVVILDRKFCAYTLLSKLQRLGIDFIIRVKTRFNKCVDEFIQSNDRERLVSLIPAGTTVKKLNRLHGLKNNYRFNVRLVRLSADVVVMTSLPPEIPVCANIYHYRWSDETTIGFLKNNLQIEIFSGTSALALTQDFIAKTIDYNILSVLIRQAAHMRHGNSDRRINRNIALGIMKLNTAHLFGGKKYGFNTNLKSVLNEIARFSTLVVENRHNLRLFRKIKHSGKYITLPNYRRAI